MLEFIKMAQAIKALYKYTAHELIESDFFELTPEGYLKIPEADKHKKWFMLNPQKLNKDYITDVAAFIIDEDEKNTLLNAVNFVNKTASALPETSSFLEKLLYTKNFIPSCLFSDTKTTYNNDKSSDDSVIAFLPTNKDKSI